jgi:hypothetical protein
MRMKPMEQPSVAASLLPKACVIVAGMHRSGTSATARVVNLLGADIARELMPAIAGNNDRGFWESKAVHDIHEALLETLGSAWDDPFPLPDGWLETDAALEAKRTLAEAVTKDFAVSRVFVVKDPRLSRLLPLWLELLDELRIEPVVVISVRNPLEVAASLQRRDGFPPAKSLLMFLRHALETELASRGRRRVFVRYDHLLADWRSFASKLGETAGARLLEAPADSADAIDGFLSLDLYRNRVSREALANAPDVPAAVVELFDRMSEAADAGEEAGLRESCDRIRATVAEATRMFGGLVPPAHAGREGPAPTPPKQPGIADFISPASFWFPDHLCDSGWIEHAPFAFWLVDAHRPSTLVELGTHWGFSFFAFCQAVQGVGADTRCFAVDTWQGDDHAGRYGEEVFEAVRSHNEGRYSAFASLVRATFDAAAPAFADGSIDLLHIDGRHFYADARHDFDTWRPKLSHRGVVVFHDVSVREHGFGVYRLWAEEREKHPHFEFPHGHGLGVLAIGDGIGERLRALFDAVTDESLTQQIRDAYGRLGAGVSERLDRRNAHKLLAIKDEHIAHHVADLAAQAAALARLNGELAAHAAAVAQLNGELAAERSVAAAQRADLDAQRGQLDAQREELDAMKRSSSWRITGPLRLAAGAFPLLARPARRGLDRIWRTRRDA